MSAVSQFLSLAAGMRSYIGVIAAALLLWPHPVAAQEEPVGQARAVRVGEGLIRVDGLLDEATWSQAPVLSEFTQKEPIEGAPPSERMEVRFVYDDTALYVGARMFKQPGSVIQAPIGRRDRVEQAEHLLVALDTFLDRRTAYVFGVTASGVRVDRFHASDDEAVFDEAFDPVWKATTNIDALGWTAELWIPFSQLRFNNSAAHVWGLNLRRYTPTLNEDDYWIAIPRTVTAWASRFGHLQGIDGLRSQRRLELMPYVASASTLIGDSVAENPFDVGANLKGRAGADLKMGVGPSLTLEATFNPDFGQVEADPAVVNLSAFETFFTEKRPFFTEGAGVLNLSAAPTTVGNNFFYSRRIGAPPTAPANGDFVDYPDTTTILAAGKLTGRLASGTSVGMLGAITDEETARVSNLGSPGISRLRVAPRTTYVAGRVQQEFGANRSTASGMVSAVHRNLGSGDPLADLLARSAFTVAGDSRLRFKRGEYELISAGGITYLQGDPAALARVQRTSVHYFQRPDRVPAIYDPTRSSLGGYKASFAFQRIGGRHWLWNIVNENESVGFEPNTAGRLSAGDGRVLNFDVRYRETTPGRLLRNYWVGARQANDWNFTSDRQAGSMQLYTSQTWSNFWTTTGSVSRTMRTMDQRLTRGGPLMESAPGWTTNLTFRNAASSQTVWSGNATFTRGEDGGYSNNLGGSLAFRPGPQWQLSIDPSILRQVDMQQYVTTLNGNRPEVFGRRYIFSGLDRSTYAMQFRLTYALKPDVTLDVYAEPFAASGRFSDFGELTAPYTLLRREYGKAPGTTATPQADGSLVVTDGSDTFRLPYADFNVRSFRSTVVLRWEYRPGSTVYMVWQQDRGISEAISERISWNDPFRALGAPGDHYFVLKFSYWLPIR